MHNEVENWDKVTQVVLTNRKVFDVLNKSDGVSSFEVNEDGETYSFDYMDAKGFLRITVRASAVDAIVERSK